MVIMMVVLYFLLACGAGWLLLFPAGRARMAHGLMSLGRRAARAVLDGQRRGAQGAAVVRHAGHARLRAGGGWLWSHRRIAPLVLLALALPPMLAWLASGRAMLGGFEGEHDAVNDHVSELLNGEQLVPPAALPPLVFTTAEVVLVRPMLGGASRNWDLLDHEFAQRLLMVFKVMREQHGVEMALLEGYRSPERQTMLAAAGPSVTNAKAFQSYHQFGLAADCAFYRDGKLIISEKDPWAMQAYRQYGAAAEAAGLHWGGRWTMMDFGHVEMHVAGTVRQ